MQLTFGSLFAGIGGFDLGFERAGFECKWQVEIDNYATKILEKHWPKVHRERDIRECNTSNLERVDCIIGGFPCQDISYAGRGAGLDGERSGLFFEAIRLVRELQPRAIVLENVAALLTRGLDRVLGTLAEIGYDAEWHCIPAAAVGAPHIRDRVFVLAYSQRDGREQWRTECKGQQRGSALVESSSFLADARCKLWQPRGVSRSRSEAAPHRIAEANHNQRCGEDVANSNSMFTQRLGESGLKIMEARHRQRQLESVSHGARQHWAVEPAVGRVANGIPARVDRLRCLGNAIVPQVAEVIARMALDRLC